MIAGDVGRTVPRRAFLVADVTVVFLGLVYVTCSRSEPKPRFGFIVLPVLSRSIGALVFFDLLFTYLTVYWARIDFLLIFVRFGPILRRFLLEFASKLSCACSLVRSFVSSFVRLRIRSFVRSFVHLFVHSFVRLRLRSHDPSFEQSIYVACIQSPSSSLI